MKKHLSLLSLGILFMLCGSSCGDDNKKECEEVHTQIKKVTTTTQSLDGKSDWVFLIGNIPYKYNKDEANENNVLTYQKVVKELRNK